MEFNMMSRTAKIGLILIPTQMFLGNCKSTDQSSEEKGLFQMFTLSQPAPGAAYKAVQNKLAIYDACKEKWVQTDLDYREVPTYPETPVSLEAVGDGVKFETRGLKFQMFEVDGRNFEKKMTAANQGTPKAFRGIWWMEGNPTPEIIVNFATGVYDRAESDFSFRYASQNAYLFPSSEKGIDMFERGVGTDAPTHIRSQSDFDFDKPEYGQSAYVSIRFLPKQAMTTIYVADGLWRRNSFGIHCYNLRRIVDENGNKLPPFDYYVNKLETINKSFGSQKPLLLIAPMEVQD